MRPGVGPGVAPAVNQFTEEDDSLSASLARSSAWRKPLDAIVVSNALRSDELPER
jgi:hypothetical protein